MKWNNGRPKKDGDYIVTYNNGLVRMITFTTVGGWNTHRQTDGGYFTDAKIDDSEILAWIPIPKPAGMPLVEWGVTE